MSTASFELPIPPRSPGALTGSRFQAEVTQYAQPARDRRVLCEILGGNLPGHLRRFVPVSIRARLGRASRVLTYQVAPDYLAVGSDDDFLRMPMTPLTAQAIGDACGCLLPTPRMVDQIHAAATVRLRPHGFDPTRYAIGSVSLFAMSNHVIERQLAAAGAARSEIVDGLKKDVVISVEVARHPGRVILYGWHVHGSGSIQPLFPGAATRADEGHLLAYMDYSHGLRLCADAAVLDGAPVSLLSLLADPELCALISDEGPVACPRYQGPAPRPLPAP